MPCSGMVRGATVAPPSRENVTAGVPLITWQSGNCGGATTRRRGAALTVAATRNTVRITRFMRGEYMIIETARLRLVPLTLAYAKSAIDDRVTLARDTGAEVPASWPPELWDQDAQDWTRKLLEADPGTDWVPRCI